jgi:hypothetical protein
MSATMFQGLDVDRDGRLTRTDLETWVQQQQLQVKEKKT